MSVMDFVSNSDFLASGSIAAFLWFAYVASSGDWGDAITEPPWLQDYASYDRRGWVFATFGIVAVFVALILMGSVR